MKVLENNHNKPKKIKCWFCDSLLEYENKDIEDYETYEYDYEGHCFTVIKQKITCPCCNAAILI